MNIRRPESLHKKRKEKKNNKLMTKNRNPFKTGKDYISENILTSGMSGLDGTEAKDTGRRARRLKTIYWRQVLLSVLISEGVILALALLCYNNLRWVIPLQILVVPIYRILDGRERNQKKKQYLYGFREVLQSLITSLQAGYSLENSSRLSLEEMMGLYPSGKNPTVEQMRKIVRGIELHCSVEQLYMQYAQETQVEEIYEFAVVLNIVRNTGGNVVEILKNTMEHLQSKMDAAEELEVSLSGRIYEKNIMLLMPFGILLYLRLTNPVYISALYSSIGGNIMMTAVIGIVLVCFFWTEKIMTIHF
ncbi:MAG: hypothetical protein LUF92_06885 [Clostridiales bacterium]|nr:hypothetical protein [Clostridiales bacterium]